MSAAHETTILPECVWVSWMAEISIRVCAVKAALQTMPAGTATAQEEKTHSSLSFSQKKQGAVLRNRPKMQHPSGTIASLVRHLAWREPATPAAPACSPSALCCHLPGTRLGEGATSPSCACLAVPGFSVPVTSLPQVSVLTMSILF